MKKFDIFEYKTLLENIRDEYLKLKANPNADLIYQNLQELLKKFSNYIQLPGIPSDLIYPSEKILFSMYRIIENISENKSEKNTF